ncbi:MAG TPA: efflux RND transporter permease subunit [Candidatus Dormibacteraeota bacterium]|nr:efflux RND transporter permease subunit [Candidatus Dormibacteraeota bacterium]
MNIAELFIRRPVMTTLVMLGILMFGIMAYRQLPVSDLPNVDFPTISVTASLPGANPETMASAVATPLERQFTTIAGLDSMISTSALGTSQITLTFNLSRQLDAAAQDVQSAIAKVASQLPRDMPSPPTYQKVNPADQPILYIALTSATLPLYTLDEYGETNMAQRISTVSGVAQVQVFGAQKYAVRIQLDPRALAARGIGIDEVAQAVQNQNVNLPTGTLYGAHKAFTVQASGQLTAAEDYRPLIVAYRNGSPVRLQELGRVIDSVENDKTAAWFCTARSMDRAIILAVQRQPGTNTVEIAHAVRALLPAFRSDLPASVSLNILYDRSVSIEASVNDVKFTLLLTLFLVVLVIFLFLRNLSATVIPSLALPFSIVGTFAVMYSLGYNLDNLSLMALTLSVGFVVDDAIVMLENIVRHMEMGEPPLQAALNGSKEIGFTILSMTLSLAAVFIPILFMGGLVGRLLHEFAVTIGTAILVSGFVSLTLTPMLGSRYLRHAKGERHGRFYQSFEWAFDRSLDGYKSSLAWSLQHKWVNLAGLVVVLALTGVFGYLIPKGLFPSEDNSQVLAFTEAIEGISFDSLVEHQKAMAAIVQKEPAVEAFLSTAGARGNTGSNQGLLFMRLKPRGERPPAEEVIQQMRPKLSQVPGMRAYLQIPPTIRIGGGLTKSLYQYALQGANTDELYRVAPLLESKMRTLPGFLDVTSDLQIKNPEIDIHIQRDKAATLGVTASQIETALYDAYGSRQISTIYAPNNEYQVIMQLMPQYQADPAALSMLYVRSISGALVPLSAVASLKQSLGPLTVSHLGQLPAVTISFNLKPGVSLGQAVKEVNDVAQGMLPQGVTTKFQGTAQAFQAATAGLGLLLVMAILVIYMVLGILYESFIHPITILSALPFAGLGALVTLYIFRIFVPSTDLSIYAYVGIIMLVGLVKKNGIMMIDFAIETRRSGSKTPEEAIFEACVVRFRPIMMTTMAALMGTLPIATGFGAGSESRRPLGLAVVGGLLFSQIITLYATPVVYVYLERLQGWLGRAPAPTRAGTREEAQVAGPARPLVYHRPFNREENS